MGELMVVPLLLVVLVAAVMVPIAVAAAARERRRLAALEQWAGANGWAAARNPKPGWTRRLPGRGRVTLLLHCVVDGLPVGVAEYFYTTTSSQPIGQGQTTTTTTRHDHVVAVVELADPYPPLAVVRRGPLSRLGRSMFGGGAATGHPEFDREFRVRTGDPRLVRSVLGPTLVAEHLAGTVPEWDLAGHALLCWWPGRIGYPAQVEGYAEAALRVARLLHR